MSDTPETDGQINGKPCTRFEVYAGDSLRDALVPSEFARKLERERNEARNIARWLDDYEAMEALLCEMQGLRDELVDVKRERDQWRIQCEQAEMALQNIATGSNCRECDGEDQARIAKDVINTASNL